MINEYNKLAECILDNYSNLNVFYVPNLGNWGDGLIHRAQKKFFKEFNIQYTQISKDELLKEIAIKDIQKEIEYFKKSLLIVGGGGAWCKNWDLSYELVKKCSLYFNKIIIMPTTYELPKIETNDCNIIYFARDKFISKENINESIFCHDMAFFASPSKFLNLFFRSFKKEGNFFRVDKEKNPLQI